MNPHLTTPDEEAEEPDTGIARTVFIAGVWALAALVLFGYVARARVAAVEAELLSAREEMDRRGVLFRAPDRPVKPLVRAEPTAEQFDATPEGLAEYDDARGRWDVEFKQWNIQMKEYEQQKRVWDEQNRANLARREVRRAELLAVIGDLKQKLAERQAALNGWPKLTLLVKATGCFLLVVGLLWTWVLARGPERVIALFGFLLFAAMLARLAVGFGPQGLELDNFVNFIPW
jgi:hypothetical protein